MTDHVYKQIEITGTSKSSIEEAITAAITRASSTIEHMRWFEMTEIRGDISNGQIVHWQVTVKIGFTLDE